MSRMKSPASFLAVAMLVALVSFASAQTATAPASAPAKSPAGSKMSSMTASSSKMAGTAKTKAASTATDTKKMAGDTKKEAAAKAAEMTKVDLNTGSKEDLMKVPGIGDATAEKIIAGRPWKMKSDLVKKGAMNSALYKKASPYMIAKAGK
jgi:competence protein ComEA